MTTYVKDGGTWRVCRDIYVKDGGIWRACDVNVKDGGIWRLSHNDTNIILSNDTVSDFELTPTTAQSQWQLDNDGTVDIPQGTGGIGEYTWLTGGAAADFEARATLVSGTLSTGTTGSWLNLGTDRTWGVSRSTFGTSTAVIDIEIRDVATSTVQATCRITLEATQDT